MSKSTSDGYRHDLAFVHDVGFGAFARAAAPWLLETLRSRRKETGRVIDLGCGSGIWAEVLSAAGYDVLGYDISAAMLSIARKRVPKGDFRQGSFLSATLAPCVAVTALGEVFNYLFDAKNSAARPEPMFHRIYEALESGGLLVFDVAMPGRASRLGGVRNFSEGDDWACLFAAEEDQDHRMLTRKITTFRRIGSRYRRDHEVHRLRLFNRAETLKQLRNVGFRVRTLDSYGEFRFPPGWIGFLARKP